MRITTLKASIKKQLINSGRTKEEAKRIVNSSVWAKDPYGWSSSADFTISTEDGLPTTSYGENYDFWNNIEIDLDNKIYFETVNGGVTAGYIQD